MGANLGQDMTEQSRVGAGDTGGHTDKDAEQGIGRASGGEPVFGFVLFGGPLSGAMVRDARLANELARRGYRVHVWWVMERSSRVELAEGITEHWLFHGLRYLPMGILGEWSGGLKEAVGRLAVRTFKEKRRTRFTQKRPWLLDALMCNVMRLVSVGVERDASVVRRFASELESAGVTHLLPMLGMLCCWAEAARRRMRGGAPAMKYLVTFQGYELYANYARQIGLEEDLYARLRAVVEASDYPAIAVSEDYRQRVIEDIGVPAERLKAIPPGVPAASGRWTRDSARQWLAQRIESWDGHKPLVCYVGRQDSEKGIDLLLYAAAMLQSRGVDMQLVIAGPTLFGGEYGRVCRQIAENLRCPVYWRSYVHEQMREALFAGSDCVVYPSIHREPFGMVAAEAMAHGTPVVVPAYGGVADVLEANGACGGLRFEAWNSGDLANQLARLIEERGLWQKLASDGPRVAEYFSIPRLADRVLAHLGLPASPSRQLSDSGGDSGGAMAAPGSRR